MRLPTPAVYNWDHLTKDDTNYPQTLITWGTYAPHPPCPTHDDGQHRQEPGLYTCACGATSIWHTYKPSATQPESRKETHAPRPSS